MNTLRSIAPWTRIPVRSVSLLLSLWILFGMVSGQEVSGPTLLSVKPENGAQEVDPSTAITFTFSAPMKRHRFSTR